MFVSRMHNNSRYIKSIALTINLWVLSIGLLIGATGITSAFGEDDENCATSHYFLLENTTEADADEGGNGDDDSPFEKSAESFHVITANQSVILSQREHQSTRGSSLPLYILFHNLRMDITEC